MKKSIIDKGIDIKIVLVGDQGVGKTSIALRYIKNEFVQHQQPTLGTSFLEKQVKHYDKIVNLQIWDTAGQEKFHSLASMYYRDAQVAILVYDVTSKTSFTILTKWLEEIRKLGPQDIVLAIAGNKCDLEENINYKDASSYATSNNGIFQQVSAKTGTGINELFQQILDQLECKKFLEASGELKKKKDLFYSTQKNRSKGCSC